MGSQISLDAKAIGFTLSETSALDLGLYMRNL
jgi:hypothetical protein